SARRSRGARRVRARAGGAARWGAAVAPTGGRAGAGPQRIFRLILAALVGVTGTTRERAEHTNPRPRKHCPEGWHRGGAYVADPTSGMSIQRPATERSAAKTHSVAATWRPRARRHAGRGAPAGTRGKGRSPPMLRLCKRDAQRARSI